MGRRGLRMKEAQSDNRDLAANAQETPGATVIGIDRRPRQQDDEKPKAPPRPALWPLPGLAPMTKVRTNFGDVHAVALREGDKILTITGDHKPIVWLKRVFLDERFLSEKQDANPFRIQAGAVTAEGPVSDILVSPRQKVRIGRNRWVEASELDGKPGIEREAETGLSYTMFHLGQPEAIYCEGVYLMTSPLAE